MRNLFTTVIAIALVCSAASAQAQRKPREVTVGNTTCIDTVTRGKDDMRCFTRSAPGGAPARDGEWTGYEGSPRDRAWMESCVLGITTGKDGLSRYVYRNPTCANGDPQ